MNPRDIILCALVGFCLTIALLALALTGLEGQEAYVDTLTWPQAETPAQPSVIPRFPLPIECNPCLESGYWYKQQAHLDSLIAVQDERVNFIIMECDIAQSILYGRIDSLQLVVADQDVLIDSLRTQRDRLQDGIDRQRRAWAAFQQALEE